MPTVGETRRDDERNRRFLRLLAPLQDEARGFARRICRSDAEGDDLFQEASLRSLLKLGELRDEDKFRFWFFRILVTVHHGRARRAFWKRLVTLDFGEDGACDLVGDDGGGWEEERVGAERARRALAILPPAQRQAVVLLEIEGFSLDEIARIQGASVTAVKTRVSRARVRLRDFYRRAGIGERPAAFAAAQGGTER
jgi:RNA polymerase sigma-70 factor, ECF subfamily